MESNDDQRDELVALSSIYQDDITINLVNCPYSGSVVINIKLDKNITVENNEYSYSIEHMPPIYLHFNLPSDYPHFTPPNFQLECSWLDQDQIFIVSNILKNRFQKGYVVLFDWMSILNEELLEMLNITNKLIVNNEQLQDIHFFNKMKLDTIFAMTFFECEICFSSVIGDQCVRLLICKHIFCKSCLSEFMRMHISEGSVLLIKCPAYNCDNDIPVNMVKDFVPPDLFDRYDNLLLNSSLELMDDATNCPRTACNSWVIIEKQINLGSCSLCLFSFCINCKQTYHGMAKCKPKPSDVANEYLEASNKQQLEMEAINGKLYLERLAEEFQNETWIESNTKLCPKCFVNIEKNGGCNVMNCKKCYKSFCWLCLTLITVDHFNDITSNCYGRHYQ